MISVDDEEYLEHTMSLYVNSIIPKMILLLGEMSWPTIVHEHAVGVVGLVAYGLSSVPMVSFSFSYFLAGSSSS